MATPLGPVVARAIAGEVVGHRDETDPDLSPVGVVGGGEFTEEDPGHQRRLGRCSVEQRLALPLRQRRHRELGGVFTPIGETDHDRSGRDLERSVGGLPSEIATGSEFTRAEAQILVQHRPPDVDPPGAHTPSNRTMVASSASSSLENHEVPPPITRSASSRLASSSSATRSSTVPSVMRR